MKEWQTQRLRWLIELAERLNKHCWTAGFLGVCFIAAGVISEDVGITWVGGVLIIAVIVMIVVVEILIFTIKHLKNSWK